MRSFVLALVVMFIGVTVESSAQSAIGTVVTLSGFVLDQHTLEPVEANYSVMDADGKKIGQSRKANKNDGYLVTGLQPGKMYTIRVEDPRYFKQEFHVSLPAMDKYAEMSRDFVVRKMEAGRKLMLVPPPFDLKKTGIKVGTEDDLAETAKILIMNPGVKVEITCYPDEALPASRAEAVSKERGDALKAFLEKQGINGSRITVFSAKTTDPLNPPPLRKGAKGKRYLGSVYLKITAI